MSVLEINSAIENLIIGVDWKKNAEIIIQRYHNIPTNSRFSGHFVRKKKKDDEETQGYTKEAGNISLKHDSPEKVKEKYVGVHIERVGYYKINKPREGIFRIVGFWKSDPETSSSNFENMPPEYRLWFHRDTLQSLAFGEEGNRLVFSFRFFRKRYEFWKSVVRIVQGENTGDEFDVGWWIVTTRI